MYEILKEFQALAAGMFAVVAAGIVWHGLDQKLDALKTEMQSAYSKPKFDLTLVGQGEYRAKVIEGVEEFWDAILAVREGREHLLVVISCGSLPRAMLDTPEEAHAAYAKAANDNFGEYARAA